MIAPRAIWVVVNVRVYHAKRLENVRVSETAQRLAAHAPHDVSQQRVPAVAVLKLGTRLEIRGALTREHSDKRIIHVDAVLARCGHSQQREPVAQSARMIGVDATTLEANAALRSIVPATRARGGRDRLPHLHQ